jgi:nifR3 family TIM-barrel protein
MEPIRNFSTQHLYQNPVLGEHTGDRLGTGVNAPPTGMGAAMTRFGPYQLPNRFMLAPMAGVSEMPFRVLALEMGAALCPTELVSAQGVFRVNARTLRYLRSNPDVERPFCLQLFGGEPEVMAQAATVAKKWGASIIDINMGCPVKKVTRSGAGSALLVDPPRAAEIVRQIRAATGLPVSAKIRLGWDAHSKNYLHMADTLGEAGVVALAVHARTRAQGYSGRADWSAIAELKRHVGCAFSIIGNGDVKSVADAHRMLDETSCDFVMIGRGALGNPWIFRELAGGERPDPEERCAGVLRHFRAHLEFHVTERVQREVTLGQGGRDGLPLPPDEQHQRAELAAVKSFRKHLTWYAHGLHGASVFRNQVNQMETAREVETAARAFFVAAAVDAIAAAMSDADCDLGAALG